MQRRTLLGITAGVAAAAATGMKARPALAADRVRITQSSWGFLFVPGMVAHELGHFAANNIAAEFTANLGGAEALAAVVAGNAEVYLGALSSSLRARERGTDATIFGASITQYASNVVVTKEWAERHRITASSTFEQKVAALRGARMAVLGIGSGTHQLTQFLAKKGGFDAARDMTIVNIPSASAMLAAFSQRRIDGFSVSSPTSDQGVREHNGVMLFHTTKGEIRELDGFLYVGFIGREAWIKQNPDLARRFLRAIQAALTDLNDPQRTLRARDVIHAKYHSRVDKAFFDQLWADAIPSWPRSVAVTRGMAEKVLAFLNEFSTQPYDASLIDRGFDFATAAAALR